MISRSMILTAILALAPTARAADDANADATMRFLPTVQASKGVMIRVPMKNGVEDQANAELKVVTDQSTGAQPADFARTWDQATAVTGVPVVDRSRDSDTSGDASTCWGWGGWNNNGYDYNYYNNYLPTYYYGYNRGYGYDNYYSYGSPSYYYDRNYSNYGYYYYPRYW